MNSSPLHEGFQRLKKVLDACHPVDWEDIHSLLNEIRDWEKPSLVARHEDALELFARGIAFLTFSYGIDGVSIEISKYANILNSLYAPFGKPSIHIIGGRFYPQAKSILSSEWHQRKMSGIDGWEKWEGGKWFDALYKTDMKFHGEVSNFLTGEMYRQAVSIAKRLGKYFTDNRISLVVPVNIASNPGNLALTLGFVLVTEIFGIYVLNSNHDFYWEAGKPPAMREPGEEPGVRDYFFRNMDNRSFFSLFQALYPWNGSRWIQANINARQSRKLTGKYKFPKKKVFEISTSISDAFFEPYSREDVLNIRLRMAHILSDGQELMHPDPVDDHLSGIDKWMKKQRPVILASRPGLSVAPDSDDLIILLQPTRVVSRKRIPRNFRLIGALLRESALKLEFEDNPNRQLILHITGPTPKEHQEDLVKVLRAYKKTVRSLPEHLAGRIFLAFSVGRESHASFAEKGFEPLTIESIYRMADAVLFPSETEGRGLPIIEASASGVPIVCSRYRPIDVFNDVIGEKLPEELRIRYTRFPGGKFHTAFLSEVANLLLDAGARQEVVHHNKKAVRARYSVETLKNNFDRLLRQLSKLG
jgi:glycosyltransferase involved in cell wall biosynthesis